MEITNEIKAKLFAQYLGQNCYRVGTPDEILLGVSTTTLSYADGDEHKISAPHKLILKPLSSITDEDAIDVCRLEGCWSKGEVNSLLKDSKEVLVSSGKHFILNLELDFKGVYKGSSRTSGADAIQVYQYLQSKGYDLPNYLLGGKTLKEVGLAIYEEEK